jgi:hypothetical protein
MSIRPALAVLVLLTPVLGGCVRRVIDVTSDPSGATVWLNDREIGRTPCSAEFTYYGTYDVRIEREGCEPVQGSAEAKAPVFDWLGIDLVSEVLPARLVSRTEWHFVLTPTDSDASALRARAEALRAATELAAEPAR